MGQSFFLSVRASERPVMDGFCLDFLFLKDCESFDECAVWYVKNVC